jgi:hypothetical protein
MATKAKYTTAIAENKTTSNVSVVCCGKKSCPYPITATKAAAQANANSVAKA